MQLISGNIKMPGCLIIEHEGKYYFTYLDSESNNRLWEIHDPFCNIFKSVNEEDVEILNNIFKETFFPAPCIKDENNDDWIIYSEEFHLFEIIDNLLWYANEQHKIKREIYLHGDIRDLSKKYTVRARNRSVTITNSDTGLVSAIAL